MLKFLVRFARTEVAYGHVVGPDQDAVRQAAEQEAKGRMHEWFFEEDGISLTTTPLSEDAECETGIASSGGLCNLRDDDWVGEGEEAAP